MGRDERSLVRSWRRDGVWSGDGEEFDMRVGVMRKGGEKKLRGGNGGEEEAR